MKTEDQLIVITGGAGGIGTACAKTFKNQPLIITDYSEDLVNQAVEKLNSEGFNAKGIACDITDKKDIENLCQFVKEQGNLKALIHTAGVSGTMKDLNRLFTINLTATEMLIEAFHELAVKNSVMVLFSSMMGHTIPANEEYDNALSNPQKSGSFEIVKNFINDDSNKLYDFTKRGVRLLMKNNANKWGTKGARIVSISPGIIETPMALKAAEEHPERMEMIKKVTPLQRIGKPEEIADVVAFLASDKASFITGTDILVDGGVLENIKGK
ncbi:MAG TPA: SDR family oxidoreductase [Flavobacteriaceae bacterium]|nr:SDR family oxidoreductase [Flavobacteriaceae bacterium]